MTYLSKGLTKPSFSNSKMSSYMTESGRDKYCEHPVSPARQAGGQLNRTREQGWEGPQGLEAAVLLGVAAPSWCLLSIATGKKKTIFCYSGIAGQKEICRRAETWAGPAPAAWNCCLSFLPLPFCLQANLLKDGRRCVYLRKTCAELWTKGHILSSPQRRSFLCSSRPFIAGFPHASVGPIPEWKPWMEHSWFPHRAAFCPGADVHGIEVKARSPHRDLRERF